MSDSTRRTPSPIAVAAAVWALLAVTTYLTRTDGPLWARLLLAAGVGFVLLVSVFFTPAPGVRRGALDGDDRYRRAKNLQLAVGAAVTMLGGVFVNPGVAVMFGIVAAGCLSAVQYKGRESGND